MFPTQIEELILKDGRLSPHYVLELSRKGRLDALKVVVEMKDGAAGSGAEGEAAARLAHSVKALIGITVEVGVAAAGTIARSMGKAKRVIDLRG